MKIEKLKKSDIRKFHELLLTIFDEGFAYYPKEAQDYNKSYWSPERLTEYISKKNRLLLIAMEGSVSVGYLIGKYYSTGNASILWLGVLKSSRGKGIGGKLVKLWEKWAIKKGAKRLRASTANFDNEKFYKSLGFSESETRERNDWGMLKLVFLKSLK